MSMFMKFFLLLFIDFFYHNYVGFVKRVIFFTVDHSNTHVTRMFILMKIKQQGFQTCKKNPKNHKNIKNFSKKNSAVIYLASKSRKVQSWPFTDFCNFILEHLDVQQQQQHLRQQNVSLFTVIENIFNFCFVVEN